MKIKDPYFLTDPELLDPITPDDYEFALSIKKEYDISFDDLCWILRELRDDIANQYPTIDKSYKEIVSPGVHIEKVHFETNKGTFTFGADMLKGWLRELTVDLRMRNETMEGIIKSVLIYYLTYRIHSFTKIFKIGTDQRKVVTGMMLRHFLLYKGVRILSEDDCIKTGKNHKQYLIKLVESRLKKYNKIVLSDNSIDNISL